MLRPGLEHQQIDFACQLFTQYEKRLQVKIQIQVKINVLQIQAKIKGKKPPSRTNTPHQNQI